MNNLFELQEVQLSYKAKSRMESQPRITNSRQAYDLLMDNCYDAQTVEYRESTKVIFLNVNNDVLGIMNVTEGGLNKAMVDVRIIMQAAILSCASGIIFSHNHPSKNTTASRQDDTLTDTLKKACKVMDMTLCDHIIVTNDNYYSYADEGKL
jgi:DNA repair protein RadC